MLCWGLIIGYHITYDLLHGSTLQIVQIKEAQRIRVSIKSSEIFQLVTDDGLFLTIDFSEYSLIQHALKKDKPVTALIEYYPKAQILKKIVLEKS